MNSSIPMTGFIGLSHLGLVSSICWASFQQNIVGVDVDDRTVSSLNENRLPIVEPGLEEIFLQHRGKMEFSTDFSLLSECPLVVISRDVPTNEKNESDLSILDVLIDRAIPHLKNNATLVLMSQVPVGYSRRLRQRIRDLKPDSSIELIYWVETLIIGNAVERCLKPERMILGVEDAARPLPGGFQIAMERYGCPLLPMIYESAELTKTAINLYLCSSVTYANTLSDLCEAVGANWSEVVPALQLDRRIGKFAYIRPSLGIRGGNLERDLITLNTLSEKNGVDARFIDTIIRYNGDRLNWVNRKLQKHVFDQSRSPVISIWGLAYKKGTASTKNSASLQILDRLQGKAEIRIYDPVVRLEEPRKGVTAYADKYEALTGADCLLILTDWEEFQTLDAQAAHERMKRPVVIDCVGVLSQSHYEGIVLERMGVSQC
ncbi:MAG: nucleotide sugar dehydrogenase [Candidatus Omnitrophota bacterium]